MVESIIGTRNYTYLEGKILALEEESEQILQRDVAVLVLWNSLPLVLCLAPYLLQCSRLMKTELFCQTFN